MTKDLDKLSKEELGKLFPIKLTNKKYNWEALFEEEKTTLQEILGLESTTRIEHIGSTAIPEIETKATVDILVEIPSPEKERDDVIKKMSESGYQYMKDHPTHIMFVKGYTPIGVEEISYHIHMGSLDEVQLWDRVYFRDYLIENPDIAKEYSGLKKKLSIEHRFDREAYTEAKGKFIEDITKEAKDYYTSK